MLIKRMRAVREMRKVFCFFANPKKPTGNLRHKPAEHNLDSQSASPQEVPDLEPEVVIHLPAGEEEEVRRRVKTDNAKVYERSLALDNEIRLLRIHPGEGPIVASLEYAGLDNPPDYDALSYCWGTQKNYRPVAIDGKDGFLLSEHLHAAIRRLRRLDHARLVWIDVICVNQANILERNRSVQLMWRIYARAHRVIIWIGETEPTQKTCRRLFASTQEADSQLTLCTQPGLAALEHDDATTKLGDVLSGMELQSSRGLDGEVWWKRLWVIQEFSRAKEHPTVYVGPHAISWPFFQRLMRTENHDRLSLFHHLRTQEEQSLLDLLFMAKSFLCSDPRDRIYALLGLVKGGQRTIVPDYSKPIPKVYEEATVYLIQQERNIDVLLDDRLDRTGGGFPTWVPHFALLRDRDTVQSRDGYAAGHGDPDVELTELPSSADEQSCCCQIATSRALRMRAIPFGRISTRTTENDLPAPDSSHRTILTRHGHIRKPELSRPLQTIEQVLASLQVDFSPPSAMGLDRSSAVGYLMLDYLFGGTRSAVEEFTRAAQHSPWKTKFATPSQDIEKLALRFGIQLTEAKKLDFMISALWENAFLTVRHQGAYTPDDVWRRLLGGSQYETYYISSKLRRRDFFCTVDGFIGMGPSTMEVGDELVVPFGASRPLVLRRHGHHHVLVGDAVVPGIMSGQLMNLFHEGNLTAENYYLK